MVKKQVYSSILPKRCFSCKFSHRCGDYYICDYITANKEPRGEEISETCSKYKKGKWKRIRWKEENYEI